jgi:AcrR family transcriptional regulator
VFNNPREVSQVPQRTDSRQSTRARTGQQQAANGQARYDEIVQIAGTLFAEKGFLATTIRDIAEAANILSGSLYHHFSSKESIADELLSRYWNELLAEYDQVDAENLPPTETVRAFIRTSIKMLKEHEYAVRMVLNDWSYLSRALPYLDANLDRIEKFWVTVINRGIIDGSFNPGPDPSLAYRTIMGAISGAGRWYRPGGRVTTDQLADHMAALFLTGLQKRPGD